MPHVCSIRYRTDRACMSGFAARHSRTVPSRGPNWSCAQVRAQRERTHARRSVPDAGGATLERTCGVQGTHLIVAQVGTDEQVVGAAPRVQRRVRHAGAPGVRVHLGLAAWRRPSHCLTQLAAICTSGVLSESFVTAHSDFAQSAQPCRRCLRAGGHQGCHGAPCCPPPSAKLALTLRCSSGSIKAQSVSVTAAPRSASACDPTLLRSAAGERAECC